MPYNRCFDISAARCDLSPSLFCAFLSFDFCQIMASSSALTLRLTSPPDFILCNNIYGANLSPQDCFIAANSHLPAGNEPLVFNTDPSIHQFYEFPLVVRHGRSHVECKSNEKLMVHLGGCQISVEAAGPNLPPSIVIIPDDLRRNARSITEKCVISRWGIGGFSTFGIRSLILYTLDSMSDLIGPYRKDLRPCHRTSN